MRAATYARYSSDKQRPASIDDQVRQCRAEIGQRGWGEAGHFSDAEIAGSVTERRPGYQELLAAARRREFDVIVVDELSRLTRDPEELARLRKRLAFWGIHLRALDGLDTVTAPEAAGPIMAIRGLLSETELAATAQRTRRGQRGRILAGYHAGGAPYSYRSKPAHADRPGDPPGTGPVVGYALVIHEQEAEIVRRVFRLYAEGWSPRRIAARLNAEGVPPPGAAWRGREGVRCTWTHSAIQGGQRKGTGLLNQEKYVGRLVWNRSTWMRDPERDGARVRRDRSECEWVVTQVEALRIVPPELWERVKRRQAQRSAATGGSGSHKRDRRLLSGLLSCGQCGARLVLTGQNTYTCSARLNRGESVCGSRVTVNAREAEAKVLDALQELVYSEGMLDEVVDRVRKRWLADRARRAREAQALGGLRQQLADVETEIRRLVTALREGLLVEDLRAEIGRCEGRREALRQELARAGREHDISGLRGLPQRVARIVGGLRGLVEKGSIAGVRKVLMQVVERIEVRVEPIEGRKRPAARLILHGDFTGALLLGLAKSTSGSSGGALLTVLRNAGLEAPCTEIALEGRAGR